MKSSHALFLAMIMIFVILSGCCSGLQGNPMYSGKNITPGYKLYNVDKLQYWKYNVTMAASGVNSTWDMTVQVDYPMIDGEKLRHMVVDTVGNGMDIQYDIWSNISSYNIERMYAKGNIGDYHQEREVSKLQIYTLPDVGLAYIIVPFMHTGNITVVDPNGNPGKVMYYSATDNKNFTVSYWVHPDIPVPVKIVLSEKNFQITMMLVDYKP
ncbi:hypothetical protein CUJ83_06080 [Methanocella sp. CWC-04]|uniref:DUF3108 domain-containing protein n=1 Tax=Methanooceanicella nereidis TaxID=2052831 RepID=A0AAP2W6S5_9EURY|nr:hypothetical protein [Methanocella sp. CWC-04]MCD1294569.1 hypothetical protein [Methanocella sp. CWC-04]